MPPRRAVLITESSHTPQPEPPVTLTLGKDTTGGYTATGTTPHTHDYTAWGTTLDDLIAHIDADAHRDNWPGWKLYGADDRA